MSEKNLEKIKERIAELTKKYETNRSKIVQLQREILQRQQEVQGLLEVDQSLRGGISELNRLLKSQTKEKIPE